MAIKNYSALTAELMALLFNKTRLSPSELYDGLNRVEAACSERGYSQQDTERVLGIVRLWAQQPLSAHRQD